MKRSRTVRLVTMPTDLGWYACVERIDRPQVGAPLGPVSDRVACAVLFAGAFSLDGLGLVAARLVVPERSAVAS